jgi:hypothetical protein
MGDTNQQCGETMEQLLKKVYTVHKDTLKGNRWLIIPASLL